MKEKEILLAQRRRKRARQLCRVTCYINNLRIRGEQSARRARALEFDARARAQAVTRALRLRARASKQARPPRLFVLVMARHPFAFVSSFFFACILLHLFFLPRSLLYRGRSTDRCLPSQAYAV